MVYCLLQERIENKEEYFFQKNGFRLFFSEINLRKAYRYKVIIRCNNSKIDRQCNGLMKKGKKASNNQQNTTQ
jgi:hypothetical protein